MRWLQSLVVAMAVAVAALAASSPSFVAASAAHGKLHTEQQSLAPADAEIFPQDADSEAAVKPPASNGPPAFSESRFKSLSKASDSESATLMASAGTATEAAAKAVPNPDVSFIPGPITSHDAAAARCGAAGKRLCSIDQLAAARSHGYDSSKLGWFESATRDIMATTCGDVYCGSSKCLSGFPSSTTPSPSTQSMGAYCCSKTVEADLSGCPASCPRGYLGDGYCDPECNLGTCRYDDGDCCGATCKDTCDKPYWCGKGGGYDCRHPVHAASGGTIDVPPGQDFSFLESFHSTNKYKKTLALDGKKIVMVRRGMTATLRVSYEGTVSADAMGIRLSLVSTAAGDAPFYINGRVKNVPPVTTDGHACKVPFVYGGKAYYGCTPPGQWNSWCFLEQATSSGWTWGYCDSAANSNVRVVLFDIPVDAPVGVYVVQSSDASMRLRMSSSIEFAVLFNPLLSTDPVYLASASEREEYLFSESGAVFQGSASSFSYVVWGFDQFTPYCYKTALLLMSKIPSAKRRSPVTVTRELSYLIGNEVLAGRWYEPYDPHPKPWTWLGSAEVLEKYLAHGQQQVKWAQCWVFSAVFTTIGRALGIPTRSVTNYNSGHDVQPFDVNLDQFYVLSAGEYVKDGSRSADSMWNFHVWNELWMTRSDVTSGSGWQAADATPQERSTDNRFVMGPASVARVKALNQAMHAGAFDDTAGSCFSAGGVRSCARKTDWVSLHTSSYDEAFVLGETSAASRIFVVDESNNVRLYSINYRTVGSLTLTQAPGAARGSYLRLESYYKSTSAFRFLDGKAVNSHISSEFAGSSDVAFSLIAPTNDIKLGDSFTIGVKAVSSASVARIIKVSVGAVMASTKGESVPSAPHADVTHMVRTVSLPAHGSDEIVTAVTLRNYMKLLSSEHHINFIISARVEGTGQLFFEPSVKVDVLIPPLQVEPSVPVETMLLGIVRWHNPMKEPLLDCFLHGHLSGTDETVRIALGDLEPLSDMMYPIAFATDTRGPATISAALDCEDLIDIHGHREVDLQA